VQEDSKENIDALLSVQSQAKGVNDRLRGSVKANDDAKKPLLLNTELFRDDVSEGKRSG